jgi:hypothetical protein
VNLAMEQGAVLLDLPSRHPLARLVELHAPVGESECEFWRRKAAERAQTINTLRRETGNLRDALVEAEAENQRLFDELAAS